MAKVVVFTPPAVPPGEPPINIKIAQNSLVSSCIALWENVQKPAVLVVTDWNKDASSFCPVSILPIVAGFFHSAANIKTVPPAI